ncbi:MAG: T9SS type A sorting domain-containing protein [Melioribacteraceae bacterium]|nr:T9SS type A sorting domain-containing protein [Melioribacteraceae bacterium]MCF8354552.1 T9SS type A sorting domain-containing protein [Melioribacteraceae bacterium]MCF8394484.1 T9SS type A sorting domain-containing protein [Melioribacteraceae bacterium]MCF8420106.1 T9SS type A sorting domain-containing protein [Melioribacteraceae bacterium]
MKKVFSFYSFLVVLIFSLTSGLIAQTTHYVATTGNDDTGDGSSINPWATIQFAVDNSDPGDIIEVAAGTYTEDISIPATHTNLEIYGDGASSIIQGVNNGGGPWPTAFVNIEILADDVKFHDFTFKNPAWDDGTYSSGMIVGAQNVEIYNVTFVGSVSDDLSDISQCFQTYNTVDISGLNLHDNTFTSEGSNTYGYEAIYINPGGTGTVTIDNNTFGGILFRGITTVREDVDITNNTLSNTQAASHAAHVGINLDLDAGSGTLNAITVTGNSVSDFDDGVNVDGAVGSNFVVNNNSFAGNTSLQMNASDVSNGSVDAEFNWWGDTDPSDDVSGDVDYSPWLGATPGTIPMSYHTDDDIQDAIDAASANDVIEVEAGEYDAITIDKELTITGTEITKIKNGSPAITITSGNVTLSYLTFDFGTTDYAIEVDGDYNNISIEYSHFLVDNGIDNANSGTYTVDAKNNYWGHYSGPTHSGNAGGTGAVVTDYVDYDPFWAAQISPVPSVSGVSITPTFTWGALSTASTYRLIVSVNSDMTSPLYDENVGDVLTMTLDETVTNLPLNNNTQYYWQVIAVDGSDATLFSSQIQYFYTVADISISLSNPSDGMAVYAYDPLQFSWYINQAQGSLKFFLQVLEGAPTEGEWATAFEEHIDGTTVQEHFYDHIATTYRSINGIDGGANYSWRVIAYYDDGAVDDEFDWEDRVVKYSTVFEFETQGGAVKAYPSWPIGANTIYNLSPTYYWYTMQYEAGATYTVYVATEDANADGFLDDEVASLVSTLDAGTNIYVAETETLDASTVYLWQVKTTYGSETNYSSIATFTTYDAPGIAPTEPTLSYPTDGVTIYSTSPTMYWYIEGYNSGTLTFEVFVDDGSGSGFVSKGTTQDTYLQISGLTPGETYDWKVVSTDGSSSVPSDTEEFTVIGGTSSYPVATYPVSNPTVYTNTPTLGWYMEGSTLGWDNFVVAWSTTDKTAADWKTQMGGGTDTYSTADMNETYFTMTSALDYGTQYYWAVAAFDGADYSDVAEGSFTTAGGDAVLVLTQPENNSVITTTDPTFYWYVTGSLLGIDSYKVEYSYSEGFDPSTTTLLGPVSTTYAEVTSDLVAGATYWWRVYVSYDGATYEIASSTWKFTVQSGSGTVVPFVGSPAHGVSINTSNPVLSWYLPTQTETSLSYEVEIADNAEFNDPTVYDDISQLNAQVSELIDGEYFWRVKSKTGDEISYYSNTANFNIGSVTEVKEEDVIPVEYKLAQNYPNPFNPSTQISYSVPEASFVMLKIYDILGNEVKTLVNNEVDAGNYNAVWSGTNNVGERVTSGIYFYRITAGDFVATKKMILLK